MKDEKVKDKKRKRKKEAIHYVVVMVMMLVMMPAVLDDQIWNECRTAAHYSRSSGS